jgi:hypothetical protein
VRGRSRPRESLDRRPSRPFTAALSGCCGRTTGSSSVYLREMDLARRASEDDQRRRARDPHGRPVRLAPARPGDPRQLAGRDAVGPQRSAWRSRSRTAALRPCVDTNDSTRGPSAPAEGRGHPHRAGISARPWDGSAQTVRTPMCTGPQMRPKKSADGSVAERLLVTVSARNAVPPIDAERPPHGSFVPPLRPKDLRPT